MKIGEMFLWFMMALVVVVLAIFFYSTIAETIDSWSADKTERFFYAFKQFGAVMLSAGALAFLVVIIKKRRS